MKWKAIIVSDLHLGTKDSKAKDFINFIEENPTELLILNGDIVDGWALSRGAKWKKQHTKVLSKLLKLANKTKIIWIRGNHDEFIKEFIGSEFGNISILENYILEVGSKRYFIFHGDVIDVFITKYKWLAKIGSIGYDFALWLNRWYNRWRAWRKLPYRSISQQIKAGVKAATNYINDFETTAIKLAHKQGCTGVVCGHIHQPADLIIGGDHYLNSGDWVENRTALMVSKAGEITLFTLKDPGL